MTLIKPTNRGPLRLTDSGSNSPIVFLPGLDYRLNPGLHVMQGGLSPVTYPQSGSGGCVQRGDWKMAGTEGARVEVAGVETRWSGSRRRRRGSATP